MREDALTEGNCAEDLLRLSKNTVEEYFVAPPGKEGFIDITQMIDLYKVMLIDFFSFHRKYSSAEEGGKGRHAETCRVLIFMNLLCYMYYLFLIQ